MQHSISLEEVILLHKNGLTNKEISLKLGTSYETIRKMLKSVGLKSKFKVPIVMIDQDHAKCKKCDDVKNIKEFQIGNRGKSNQYYYAFCNICRNKKVYNQLSDNLESYLAEIYRKICKRSKNKINLISKEDFISQYHFQNGKCFYTDENLICVRGQGFHRNGLSVDKIIPEHDYIKGNIVFCCRKINVCKNDLSLKEIKQWMPDWYARIKIYELSKIIECKNIKLVFNWDDSKIDIVGCNATGSAYYNHIDNEIQVSCYKNYVYDANGVLRPLNKKTAEEVLYSIAHEYGHSRSLHEGFRHDSLNEDYKKQETTISVYNEEKIAWRFAQEELTKLNAIINQDIFTLFKKKALDGYIKNADNELKNKLLEEEEFLRNINNY